MLKFILLSFVFIYCQSKVIEVEGLTINTHNNQAFIAGENVKDVPEHLKLKDIGNLISSSYWTKPLSNADVKLDYSFAPEANLLVVAFGAKGNNNNNWGQSTNVDYDFFPADAVSLTTTLSTSEEPSVHGVIGANWFNKGNKVTAYTDDNKSTFSSIPSFVDLITSAHGQTKTITASHCPKLAKSIAQGNDVHTLNENNEFTTDTGSFTMKDLKEILPTNEFWQQFDIDEVQEGSQTHFLMEIEYIRRLVEKMTDEDGPVLYNLAVYIPEDFPRAQEIFSKAVSSLKSKFNTIHPTGSSQVVLLNEPTIEEVGAKPSPYQEQVFSQSCVQYNAANGATADPNSLCATNPYSIVQDSRSYQISTWTSWMAFFFLYMFCVEFAYMSYDNDSVLFSRYKRDGGSSSIGMGGRNTGAFNIAQPPNF